MEEKNLWTTFEKTGSIVDYLHYKGIREASEKQDIGERSFESDSSRNGNDSVRDTYR